MDKSKLTMDLAEMIQKINLDYCIDPHTELTIHFLPKRIADKLAIELKALTDSYYLGLNNEVDRFEVIDGGGREYVKGSIYGTPIKIELSYQDEGRTLKVFVEPRELRNRIGGSDG